MLTTQFVFKIFWERPIHISQNQPQKSVNMSTISMRQNRSISFFDASEPLNLNFELRHICHNELPWSGTCDNCHRSADLRSLLNDGSLKKWLCCFGENIDGPFFKSFDNKFCSQHSWEANSPGAAFGGSLRARRKYFSKVLKQTPFRQHLDNKPIHIFQSQHNQLFQRTTI